MGSPYAEYRSPSHHGTIYEAGPSNYARPDITGSPHPSEYLSPSRAYTYGSHQSRDSSRQTYASNNPTYSWNPPRPAPPPVEAIHGLPTPAPRAQGLYDADDIDPEYMDVEAPAEVEGQGIIYEEPYEEPDPSQRPRRRFVGGFVAGLKRLPKAMRRGFMYDKRTRSPAPDVYGHEYVPEDDPADFEGDHARESAPPYDAPGEPLQGEVHYVEAMDMPTGLAAPPTIHTPSHSMHSARSPSHLTAHSLSHPSMRQSQHGSLHPSQNSVAWTVRNPDPDPPSATDETATNYKYQHPLHPQAPQSNSGSTAPTHPQPQASTSASSRRARTVPSPVYAPEPTNNIGSPIYVEPLPTTDYGRMASPVQPPPEPTLPSQLARVGNFFRELNGLPWIASSGTITTDYVAEDSARSRYLRAKDAGSWYAARHRTIDLLAGGPSTRALAPGGVQGSSATLHRGAGGSTSSGSGGSSGGHGHAHAQIPPPGPYVQGPYAYPVPIAGLPQQPVYLYPTAAFQPVAASARVSPEQQGGAIPGGSADGQLGQQVPMQMGQPGQYPMYMVALPPASYMMPGQVPQYAAPYPVAPS
ncbi:hypothetical protein FA95DRAFT_1608951 [Auriscalpium vulgare]|uniref:Uncharacterized protein n=1 Tax=Auriscalpium vulgare TaxID=40419 RepID=A0ACB8RJ59_9AGAM|nr:hypothetical protein FA95DRAFT_1608951 [Auriscalpium vulgare]